MKRLVAIPVLILLLILFSGAQDFGQTNNTVVNTLQQDLDTLLSWFPGEYDNHQQVYKEAVDKLPLEKRHRQTHHIFSEVITAL